MKPGNLVVMNFNSANYGIGIILSQLIERRDYFSIWRVLFPKGILCCRGSDIDVIK